MVIINKTDSLIFRYGIKFLFSSVNFLLTSLLNGFFFIIFKFFQFELQKLRSASLIVVHKHNIMVLGLFFLSWTIGDFEDFIDMYFLHILLFFQLVFSYCLFVVGAYGILAIIIRLEHPTLNIIISRIIFLLSLFLHSTTGVSLFWGVFLILKGLHFSFFFESFSIVRRIYLLVCLLMVFFLAFSMFIKVPVLFIVHLKYLKYFLLIFLILGVMHSNINNILHWWWSFTGFFILHNNPEYEYYLAGIVTKAHRFFLTIDLITAGIVFYFFNRVVFFFIVLFWIPIAISIVHLRYAFSTRYDHFYYFRSIANDLCEEPVILRLKYILGAPLTPINCTNCSLVVWVNSPKSVVPFKGGLHGRFLLNKGHFYLTKRYFTVDADASSGRPYTFENSGTDHSSANHEANPAGGFNRQSFNEGVRKAFLIAERSKIPTAKVGAAAGATVVFYLGKTYFDANDIHNDGVHKKHEALLESHKVELYDWNMIRSRNTLERENFDGKIEAAKINASYLTSFSNMFRTQVAPPVFELLPPKPAKPTFPLRDIRGVSTDGAKSVLGSLDNVIALGKAIVKK